MKRLAATLLAVTTILSLTCCTGNGGIKMDKSNLEAVVNYDAEYQGNPYLPLWEYIPDGEPYVF